MTIEIGFDIGKSRGRAEREAEILAVLHEMECEYNQIGVRASVNNRIETLRELRRRILGQDAGGGR